MTDQMTPSRSFEPTSDVRRWFTVGAIGLVLIAATVASYLALALYFVRSETQITPQRAAFFAGSLDAALTRLEHLPYVLSIDPTTLAALETGDVGDLNPILADIADRAQAEFVYLLDINGLTIASSNYHDLDTLVGNSYTFRPISATRLPGARGATTRLVSRQVDLDISSPSPCATALARSLALWPSRSRSLT